MTKVICIEAPSSAVNFPKFKVPPMSVGDELTVADSDEWQGESYYFFVEYGPMLAFAQKLFATLNGPDETERLEEWQQERLTATDKMLQLCAETMPAVEMPAPSWERVWQRVVKKEEGAV